MRNRDSKAFKLLAKLEEGAMFLGILLVPVILLSASYGV